MAKKALKIGGGILVLLLALWFAYLSAIIASDPYGVIICAGDNVSFVPGAVCRGYMRHIGVPKDIVDAINTNGVLVGFVFDVGPEHQEDVLVSLLKSGVEINSKDNRRGITPLHDAVFSDKPLILSLFLAHGADPKIRDAKGRTPLEFAEALSKKYPATKESVDVIRLLKEAGG